MVSDAAFYMSKPPKKKLSIYFYVNIIKLFRYDIILSMYHINIIRIFVSNEAF